MRTRVKFSANQILLMSTLDKSTNTIAYLGVIIAPCKLLIKKRIELELHNISKVRHEIWHIGILHTESKKIILKLDWLPWLHGEFGQLFLMNELITL